MANPSNYSLVPFRYPDAYYLNREDLVPQFSSLAIQRISHLINQRFIDFIMGCSINIREVIYLQLVTTGRSESNNSCTFCRTHTRTSPNWSTRNFALAFNTNEDSKKASTKAGGAWITQNRRLFNGKLGLEKILEYGDHRYHQVSALVVALIYQENWLYGASVGWTRFGGSVQGSMLLDFLGWFWGEMILSLKEAERLHWTTYVPLFWLQDNVESYRRITRLSIDFKPDSHSSVINTRNPRETEFLRRTSNFIATNLPNLRHLTLWVHAHHNVVLDILSSPGAHSWIAAFQKIRVEARFEVRFLLETSRIDHSILSLLANGDERQNLQGNLQKKLQLILRPESLSQGTASDAPYDFGLKWLFGLDED